MGGRHQTRNLFH